MEGGGTGREVEDERGSGEGEVVWEVGRESTEKK